MARSDLSVLQLQIVMHLANGMKIEEIASTIVCSISHINQQTAIARRKTATRTLPQLVSTVIASGQLRWNGQQRVVEYSSFIVDDDGAGSASSSYG